MKRVTTEPNILFAHRMASFPELPPKPQINKLLSPKSSEMYAKMNEKIYKPETETNNSRENDLSFFFNKSLCDKVPKKNTMMNEANPKHLVTKKLAQ